MTRATERRRFGPDARFELQPLERRLLVDGVPAPLGARAFDLLLELAARPGVLRTKHELIEAVWPGVIVEEGNLATQISGLRKVLGGEVIATIPGRGYRFTASVDTASDRAGPSLDAVPPSDATPKVCSQATARPTPETPKLRTNLPATLPRLVGRSEDLEALQALVDQHRLVSIVGAGGMGKTTVALHLTASRPSAYRHGVCWVELATVTRSDDVPSAIASAIGVSVGSGDPLAGLCSALMPLTMLVVLDNAEQVLESVAHVVHAALQKAPGVRFMVTAQAPLKLSTEVTYRIGPLAVPEGPLPARQALGFGAVALFADRAQAADSRFEVNEANLPAVIEICQQLDGLALAIELAAARAPMLGVQRLAASMGQRLKLLTGGRNRLAPARQQTLRAALEWSHGFLNAAEQAVFRRLAVFSGSGSLTMIQQVVADPEGAGPLDEWAVLDALALLVDRSLVVAITADHDHALSPEPRYKLLETPRAFALERLKAADEEATLRHRHMQAMAAFCEQQWHAGLSGEIGQTAWLIAFMRDAENAREAMAHAATCDPVAALQIGAVLTRTSINDWPATQKLEHVDQCISLLDASVPPLLQVRIWIHISRLLGNFRPARALEAARAAVALVRSHAELQAERFMSYLAECALVEAGGRGAQSLAEVREALERARALEDPRWPPHRRFRRSYAEFATADPASPAALRLGREMLALDLASGGDGFRMRSNLIDVELAAGDAHAAAQTGEALLADVQGGRNEITLAFARLNLAAAWLRFGKLPRARELAQIGWTQGRLFDMQPYWADYLAALAALEGRPRAATRVAGYADAAYAARQGTREFNEANAYDCACTLAREALGPAAFERLLAEGRRLIDEEIEAIALGTEDLA